ncbi:MAG: isoprenylcysteine carboxylmethyltransferase family protein [Candidatus Aminicenantes bacterium]|nr:isoprenylcysteine carboxylmethyltransferase family protein [Candidatus Aminicenantes bacterium]
MPETKLMRTLYRWRVRSGPLALLAVTITAAPTVRSLLIGAAVAALGLTVRAWAAGHIRKEKALAVTGPYRHSRNPLYVGNFILGVGIAVATNSWWGVLAFAIYFGLFYPLVILEERDRMRRIFPDQYGAFEKSVPLFFPRIKPAPANGEWRFHWSQYRRNKEYRALAGTILTWGLLILKMLFLPNLHP